MTIASRIRSMWPFERRGIAFSAPLADVANASFEFIERLLNERERAEHPVPPRIHSPALLRRACNRMVSRRPEKQCSCVTCNDIGSPVCRLGAAERRVS